MGGPSTGCPRPYLNGPNMDKPVFPMGLQKQNRFGKKFISSSRVALSTLPKAILSKSRSPAFVRLRHSPPRRRHSPSPSVSNRLVSVSSVSNRLVSSPSLSVRQIITSLFSSFHGFMVSVVPKLMMDNEDTMNLEDTEYMSGDEMVDQNSDEDEAVAVEDTLMRTAENRRKRGGKRRHSRCWKHFNIIGENYPDGSNDIPCKFCNHTYNFNLRRSGTSDLLRHMKARIGTSNGNLRRSRTLFVPALGPAPTPVPPRISGLNSIRSRSDAGETDHPPGSEYGSALSGTRIAGLLERCIEFLQNPSRTPASGSPLEGTPVHRIPARRNPGSPLWSFPGSEPGDWMDFRPGTQRLDGLSSSNPEARWTLVLEPGGWMDSRVISSSAPVSRLLLIVCDIAFCPRRVSPLDPEIVSGPGGNVEPGGSLLILRSYLDPEVMWEPRGSSLDHEILFRTRRLSKDPKFEFKRAQLGLSQRGFHYPRQGVEKNRMKNSNAAWSDAGSSTRSHEQEESSEIQRGEDDAGWCRSSQPASQREGTEECWGRKRLRQS
ncbi:hypothetical protein DY000_02042179 [Brassica cretica]|uniref:BED-type domain-containing protein n=1 Tax=Brassica cretica TaxID=69181 RepID=A0ABQ7BQC4_BRACR|nr:hypothetical protein DY000_02042179 [Brassica cretica]